MGIYEKQLSVWLTARGRSKDMPGWVFVCQVLWALGLLGLFLAYVHSNDRLGLPRSFGKVPVEAPWLGAVGGLLASLGGISYFSRGRWEARFNYWHPVKPLMGLASGAVACLLITVLVRVATSSAKLELDTTALDAVAFVFGFAESAFRELVKSVTDVFLRPGGSKSGTGNNSTDKSSARAAEPNSLSIRTAGSLPFPTRPAGTSNEEMPFDHIVVVMMENHSFDNLLGALTLTHPGAEGLSFVNGVATNSNPGTEGTPNVVPAFPLTATAQGEDVSQSWKDTHEQVNSGKMDGFVKSMKSVQPMGYYTPEALPFAYSLASTFTLANRWFCSMPGPTYPNRRFLLAGTAFGGTATNKAELLRAFGHPPPNGTIFDVLSRHNITWSNYFSDVPMTMVIPRTIIDHLDHHAPIANFFDDCRTGNLPAVSFVDPRIGALSKIGKPIGSLPSLFKELLTEIEADLATADSPETQEDPQDMHPGEVWAHSVIEAVLQSPRWPRTLLIYTYDEHGGYYDHIPPPPAIPPDDIAPLLQPGDPTGSYDLYGPRVPAVVVSPYSKPGGTTNVVHDHTSVLATIEAKWNLPTLTNRDANAATVMDFLDLGTAAFLNPPKILAPSTARPSGPADR